MTLQDKMAKLSATDREKVRIFVDELLAIQERRNQPSMERFQDQHCPMVAESRDWRNNFGLPNDPADDRQYAECSFQSRGCGIGCENCDFFMTPVMGSQEERKWVPFLKSVMQQTEEEKHRILEEQQDR